MTRGHKSEKSAKEKTQTRNRERKDARDVACLPFDHTQVRKQTPQAANRSFNFRDEKCVRLFTAKTSCSHSPQLIGLLRVKRTLSRARTPHSHNCYIFWSMHL